MKKLYTLLCLTLLVLSNPFTTLAATPTKAPEDTPKASQEAEIKTIEKIKEMVADKVSKLKLVDKRGFIGTVVESSTTQIITQDIHGTKRYVDIDELTKFQESIGSSKTFGISDIEKGDRLSFIGLYNKETERLLARFITKTASVPDYLVGKVASVDEKNFQFDLQPTEESKKTIDVQRSTTTDSYSDDDGEQKSGFSKLEEGQMVFVAGFQDDKDKTLFSASRILHIISGEAPSPTESK
jgi:hypothetical protein